MKNILLALFLMVGVFGLVACSDATDEPATDEPVVEEVQDEVETPEEPVNKVEEPVTETVAE